VQAAAKIEEERTKYFEKQVQALKQADLKVRKERSAVHDEVRRWRSGWFGLGVGLRAFRV
jgi:hypothetical protein